jgi:hypothetical protein
MGGKGHAYRHITFEPSESGKKYKCGIEKFFLTQCNRFVYFASTKEGGLHWAHRKCGTAQM